MKVRMIGFIALCSLMAWNYWAVICGLLSIMALHGCADYAVSLLRKKGR